MFASPTRGAAIVVALALQQASAHSYVSYVLVNGLLYHGFTPRQDFDEPANAVGWSTTVLDDGFVAPDNYTTADIICHRGGAPPRAHVPVSPGDAVHVQWNGWPLSHEGPVLSYLAPCDGDDGCASVDKTRLGFFKIDDSAPALLGSGRWATEVLIASNNSWLVRLPAALSPGPYVLRHELIALHYAGRPSGAQNYPQCINIWVTGDEPGGNATVAGGRAGVVSRGEQRRGQERAGVLATDMYHAHDPGIDIDIYQNLTTYQIPGPTLVRDARPVPLSSQTNMVSRAAGTPVLVSGTVTIPFPCSTETRRPDVRATGS